MLLHVHVTLVVTVISKYTALEKMLQIRVCSFYSLVMSLVSKHFIGTYMKFRLTGPLAFADNRISS